ncbi:hypothetical protein Hs30E_08190 [Lactococcus hodotermopsidis]|uniref:Uncharacterized protein n=1 Tax=Pseudolactococcus hodotermopsidis TaxID=2709157 RepID=A0A6A0BD41_9LACT|nr:hypothetical protein [Lactococcus hodotermopsidis]GFH42268.1 hypothetical protein Hs30E_08190 [Lactococcus hodotermopsidis]
MKTESTAFLIAENNVLKSCLNAENKAYFEKIISYMRAISLLKNELEIENILLNLLKDLLVAQENGESALAYFGKNPQEMCEGLIENIGKRSFKETLTSLLAISGGYLLITLFLGLFMLI